MIDLIAIIVTGCAYSVLIQPDELLESIPTLLNKWLGIKNKWRKPLGACAKCTFGWISMIYYLVAYYDVYVFWHHILFVSTTITVIYLWQKKVIG